MSRMHGIVNCWSVYGEQRMDKKRIWEGIRPYVLIAPAMTGILLFVMYPVGYLMYLSLFKYNLMNKDKSRFVGLDNFTQILSRGDFYKALWNTSLYTVGVVVLTMMLSLLIAVWLNKKEDSTRSCRREFSRPM